MINAKCVKTKIPSTAFSIYIIDRLYTSIQVSLALIDVYGHFTQFY